MAKKKTYVNKYKAGQNKEAGADGKETGGKKKLSFKAYLLGVAVVVGLAAFFLQSLEAALVSMGLFLVGAWFMGKEQYVFLGIGALMGLLLALANEGASIPISIALVWSLFYIMLMVMGMFIMRRK